MKTIKVMLILYLLLIMISHSCKFDSNYYDYRLKVVNNSYKTIYADFYQSYPDTTLSSNFHFSNSTFKAEPSEIITLVRGGTWENAFKNVINSKLMVFVFDAAIVNNVPWDTIRKNYLILKRYDLSQQDLENMNWNITYP